MLNNMNHQQNANQNHNEVSPHTDQDGHHRKSTKINAGGGVEKRVPSCTVGGNVNCYSRYGEQHGGSLEN